MRVPEKARASDNRVYLNKMRGSAIFRFDGRNFPELICQSSQDIFETGEIIFKFFRRREWRGRAFPLAVRELVEFNSRHAPIAWLGKSG
jgi:hypothetical protein